MGIPEREESEQGVENLFEEILTQIFLILVKEKKSHKSRKLRESQTSWTQRAVHQDI